MLKNWCFWIVLLEKTPEGPLDSKEMQPVNPKENKPWLLIGRTNAGPAILCPLDEKSSLIRKDPDAGKDWRQEQKGMTEDELVGWHHRLNGHELDQTPGVGKGQGSLVCCSPWGQIHLGIRNHYNVRLDWATKHQQQQGSIRRFLPSKKIMIFSILVECPCSLRWAQVLTSASELPRCPSTSVFFGGSGLVAKSNSCDPVDCSPPGFSVHEIFQARILECVAISFSRGSSSPRDQTRVSCIAGGILYRLSYGGSFAL